MPAKTMDEIASILKTLKFKKRLFGGVDEAAVWRVLERMQTEYRSLVEETQLRYSALIDERDDKINEQQKLLAQLQLPRDSSDGGDADA